LSYTQNYPVNITTQLVAPFSGYISDYANPGEEKLKLLFLFTDFTKPHYNVKLKISIQGQGITIQSKSYFFDGPHTLQPGVPFELSGSDLYNLLNTQNLDFNGITKAQYEQKKVLPEGFYSICITAYDYNSPTPIQVSNNACVQVWMVLSDPPFLNLPICSNTVVVTNPQQQTFSFTQMNMGSPNSAANTEYVFELWEIRPQGAVPNNIIQTVPPIYSYTTNFTSINYSITEPPLLVGMQYAWRVKAQDISGRDYFKNNGYSQICTFTYGSPYDGLNINLNLHAQAVNQRQIKIWWDSLSNFTSYKLEFRKSGSSGNWFPVTTVNSHLRILDLEPQTTYEFHVQGVSTEYISSFSSPVNATTQSLPNYQCGELPTIPTSANFAPLQQANTNMIWQVGQFEMYVTELQNTTSAAGLYSGYGKIKLPFINFVYCSFNNINVSNEQIVVQGKVNALTQGIDQWINDNGTGTIQDGTAEPEIHTSTPITANDIHVNTSNGTVIVEGNTYTYTPSGTTIEDSNGNIFILTSDGQIINAGSAGNGHGPVPDSKNFIVTDKGVVNFNVSPKQMYGTDKFKYPTMINYYLTVRNITANSPDPVDWKSVMMQKYDVIDLNYQLQGNLKADSILFITGTGTIYKPQGTGTSRQLYIVGGKHGDVQELFACYRYSKDSLINIAKINIVSYRNEQNKVTLVPLDNSVIIDKTHMQKQLNEIYKQSIATWEVDVAPAITVGDTTWDKDGNGKINVGSNIFSRYSNELKAINKYIRTQTYYKRNEYFLIVTDKPTDSLAAGLLGEMPRGRNIGYLFTSVPTPTLVAHELGHGAFALEHSFEGNATLPTGNSCLMDYNNGTELYKGKYWDYVHNPVSVVGGLEGDDDGAMVGIKEDKSFVLDLLNKIKKSYKDNSQVVVLKNYCLTYSATDLYIAGIPYNGMLVYIDKPLAGFISLSSKNKITKCVKPFFDPFNQKYNFLNCLDIDGKIKIRVPDNRLDIMLEYLKCNLDGNNLLIFSNGYRPAAPSLVENPKPADEINLTDINSYWKGIDAMFINRIGTRNVVYADGHHSVATSNHNSQASFVNNLAEWSCATNILTVFYSNISPTTAIPCTTLFIKPSLLKLHTTSNSQGFAERRANGNKAGQDLIIKINNGIIKFDVSKDTIDIVCHSFGYAYALGIIDALKASGQNYKFGRFYGVAPENACSGSADFNSFEEVWQYGSNEGSDKVWEQDGVAPQCEILGFSSISSSVKHARVYFPDKLNPKTFLDCHYIDNYYWLFSISYDKNTPNGYVKPRK
jgi:hypothetical protein